jgi:hypothetical protein
MGLGEHYTQGITMWLGGRATTDTERSDKIRETKWTGVSGGTQMEGEGREKPVTRRSMVCSRAPWGHQRTDVTIPRSARGEKEKKALPRSLAQTLDSEGQPRPAMGTQGLIRQRAVAAMRLEVQTRREERW